MRRAIIVFTRVPVAGQTKTRLMPYFSPQECAGLHTCFLKDIARAMSKNTGGSLYLLHSDDKGAALKNIFGDDKIYFPRWGNLWEKECTWQSRGFLPKIMDPVC